MEADAVGTGATGVGGEEAVGVGGRCGVVVGRST